MYISIILEANPLPEYNPARVSRKSFAREQPGTRIYLSLLCPLSQGGSLPQKNGRWPFLTNNNRQPNMCKFGTPNSTKFIWVSFFWLLSPRVSPRGGTPASKFFGSLGIQGQGFFFCFPNCLYLCHLAMICDYGILIDNREGNRKMSVAPRSSNLGYFWNDHAWENWLNENAISSLSFTDQFVGWYCHSNGNQTHSTRRRHGGNRHHAVYH